MCGLARMISRSSSRPIRPPSSSSFWANICHMASVVRLGKGAGAWRGLDFLPAGGKAAKIASRSSIPPLPKVTALPGGHFAILRPALFEGVRRQLSHREQLEAGSPHEAARSPESVKRPRYFFVKRSRPECLVSKLKKHPRDGNFNRTNLFTRAAQRRSF